jgi:hypothetical protein
MFMVYPLRGMKMYRIILGDEFLSPTGNRGVGGRTFYS